MATAVNPRDMLDFSAFKTPEFDKPAPTPMGEQLGNAALHPFRMAREWGRMAWGGHGGPGVLENAGAHLLAGHYAPWHPRTALNSIVNTVREPYRRAYGGGFEPEMQRGQQLFRTIGHTVTEPYRALKSLQNDKFLKDPSDIRGY